MQLVLYILILYINYVMTNEVQAGKQKLDNKK